MKEWVVRTRSNFNMKILTANCLLILDCINTHRIRDTGPPWAVLAAHMVLLTVRWDRKERTVSFTVGPQWYLDFFFPVVCRWKYQFWSACVYCTRMCTHTDKPAMPCALANTHVHPCKRPKVTYEGIKTQQGYSCQPVHGQVRSYARVSNHTQKLTLR